MTALCRARRQTPAAFDLVRPASLAISESFDLLGLQIASPVLKHTIIDGQRTAVRPVRRMLG
jgi:hypothetical protein